LKKAVFVILFILIADQILKFWVKTNMYVGQDYSIFGNWFLLYFTENNGMAFGIQFAGQWGKLFLSIFRIIAILAIGWYLLNLIKKKAHSGLIVCMSMIIAGAIGNIIDSAFYGLLFSSSPAHSMIIASFLPEGGGYAPLLYGKVVDMLKFQVNWPLWVPWIGGREVFPPVFNIADSSITTGVIILILFQRKFFGNAKKTDSLSISDSQ